MREVPEIWRWEVPEIWRWEVPEIWYKHPMYSTNSGSKRSQEDVDLFPQAK